MKNGKVAYIILAIIGLIILSRLSALNKPRYWDDNAFYYNLEQQDTLKNTGDTLKKKEIIRQASLKPGSPEYIDSMKQSRQRYVDSMKQAQAAMQDSLKKERQRIADSTAVANKRYNDSVRAVLELQKLERQRAADSLRVIQTARKDSLDRLKAYRESKAYKDSIAAAKQARADSIASVRQMRADSLAKVRVRIKDSLTVVRKQMQDSLATVRKNMQDSLATVRKKYNDSIQVVLTEQKVRNQALKDSIAAVRAIRTDSLAKAKVEREALAKKRVKDREKSQNAKMRAKEQKKRDAYSNEDMRKKKWSFLRRAWHNTTTKYNYHYNARERLRKVEENMLRNSITQYDSLLPLFPFNPDVDSAKYAVDLDSLIRKAGVGIQIHDPRSRWQDNMYLIVGKAYYYKGDYKNAAAAFKYIVATAEQEKKEKAKNKDKKAEKALGELPDEESRNFLLHHTSKNEAIMWLARTLAQDSQLSLAQTVLNMMRSSKQYNNLLDGRFATVQSFVDLKQHNHTAAASDLVALTEDKNSPDWLRQRAAFIRGQLLQKEGRFQASDSAFDKVIALKPEMEMDFYAKMNKVNNSLNGGFSDTRALLASLQKMSRETKYKDYYDKIHFAQARVYEAAKDTATAIAQYRKAISTSTKNLSQKGLAFAGLGNIYYLQNDYNTAKSSYDSALVFLTDAQNPTYSIALQRAGALDYIAGPGNEVKYNDSLLRLSQMSEKDQLAVVRRQIRDLEKHLLDSLYAARNAATAPQALPAPTSLSSGKQSWYFSNPSNMQKGIATFKQKWGDRKLKDDWNRSSQFGSSGSSAEDATAMSEEDQLRATLPSESDLMALIPKGKPATDSVSKALETALYQLGVGYYKHMEDIPMALNTFDELDRRYPQHNYGAELTYYRYLTALNNNDKAKVAEYLAKLQSQYGTSEWAKMVAAANQESAAGAQSNGMSIAEHYEGAYNALMTQDFSKAYRDAEAAPALYPKEISPYQKKYTLVKYAAIAGNKDYREADSLLTIFVAQNQSDETLQWAKNLQQYVKVQLEAWRKDSARLSSQVSGPAVLPGDSSLKYSYKPENLHYVMVSTPVTDNKINGLRAGLRDYNSSKAARKKLEVTITPLDAQRSVIVVQEFKNAAEAKKYIAEISKVKELFREFTNANEYELLIISNDNILKLYTDKNWQAYIDYYKSKY